MCFKEGKTSTLIEWHWYLFVQVMIRWVRSLFMSRFRGLTTERRWGMELPGQNNCQWQMKTTPVRQDDGLMKRELAEISQLKCWSKRRHGDGEILKEPEEFCLSKSAVTIHLRDFNTLTFFFCLCVILIQQKTMCIFDLMHTLRALHSEKLLPCKDNIRHYQD